MEENRMKRFLSTLCIVALMTTAAVAQNQPAKSGPNNNAVNSAGQNNSNAPVAGRNSFTEGQAKSKIESAGYSNVSDLKKDDNGVWRGKASKGGSATQVSVDFQGNVNPVK
jgi:hypothetical protein